MRKIHEYRTGLSNHLRKEVSDDPAELWDQFLGPIYETLWQSSIGQTLHESAHCPGHFNEPKWVVGDRIGAKKGSLICPAPPLMVNTHLADRQLTGNERATNLSLTRRPEEVITHSELAGDDEWTLFFLQIFWSWTKNTVNYEVLTIIKEEKAT